MRLRRDWITYNSWSIGLEIMTLHQPQVLSTHEMDSRFSQGNRPMKKENKKFEKNQFTNSIFADILVRNSHLPFRKLSPQTQKKTKITTKVLGVDKDVDEVKTHLWQIPRSLSRRKKMTSPNLSASTARKRVIIPTGNLKRRNKSQKTIGDLGKLHACNCSYKRGSWRWWKSDIYFCTSSVHLLPHQL